jgi:hypothetical protein
MGTDIAGPRKREPLDQHPGPDDDPDRQHSLDDDYERSDSEQELEGDCEDYADDLEITDQQGEDVADRRDRLREVLDSVFDIDEEHIFGSLTRETLVGPLTPESDTDAMFVLDTDVHGDWLDRANGDRDCLRAIKRAIENDPNYAKTDVSIDRNAVAVEFSDFTVDIVPAFSRGSDYVIPDTYEGGQSWVRTNPRQYKQQFEATNEAHDGNLAKLARMAKAYNEDCDTSVSSYHTELMAYDYVRSRPNTDAPLDTLLNGFFKDLPSRLSSGVHDPATDQRVDAGLSTDDRLDAIEAAQTARERIKQAEQLTHEGNLDEAREAYRDVFDDHFGRKRVCR